MYCRDANAQPVASDELHTDHRPTFTNNVQGVLRTKMEGGKGLCTKLNVYKKGKYLTYWIRTPSPPLERKLLRNLGDIDFDMIYQSTNYNGEYCSHNQSKNQC